MRHHLFLAALVVATTAEAVPLRFEANVGQADPSVLFLARTNHGTLFLTREGAVLAAGGAKAAAVAIRLVAASAGTSIAGESPSSAVVNVLRGRDPAGWRMGVPTFSRVRHTDVYPGVDVVYHGDRGELEYDLVVTPGADPGAIGWRFEGATSVALDERGDLLVATAAGHTFRQLKPRVLQQLDGAECAVAASYVQAAADVVGLALEAYDATLPLIVDPVLVFSTYLGGSGDEFAAAGNPHAPKPGGGCAVSLGTRGIQVDARGAIYVVGMTSSVDFPAAGKPPAGGDVDIYVTRLAPGGEAIEFTTLYGGSGNESAELAVSPDGRIALAGGTDSTDLPLVRALQAGQAGFSDGFLAVLEADGATLGLSTYLGGASADQFSDLAWNPDGSLIAGGYTQSQDVPLLRSLRAFDGRCSDGWLVRVEPIGPTLEYSTLLGGTDWDWVQSVGTDREGDAYVAGATHSPDLAMVQPIQSAPHGPYATFFQKLDAQGRSILRSSYLGGSETLGNEVHGLHVDASGAMYIVGTTSDPTFPLRNPLQSALPPGSAYTGFVVKIDAQGALDYSTYYGDGYFSTLAGVAADASGAAYVASYGTHLPLVDPLPVTQGGSLGFQVAKLSPGGDRVEYRVRVGRPGGGTSDRPGAVAVDGNGTVYLAGDSYGSGFPLERPVQGSFGGGSGDTVVIALATCALPSLGNTLWMARQNSELVAAWVAIPDATSYALFTTAARTVEPDTLAASATETGTRLPLPADTLALYRVAARSSCAPGPR